MPSLRDLLKRVLVGRALHSDRLHETLLPKRVALPVFASDALSSVAYAPQEILLTLSAAGLAAYHFSPWVGLAVVVVMLIVVTSYRQNVRAYPSGGGDYEVATVNLGPNAGLTVASALLVDYVLTVAVSVSSGADYVASRVDLVQDHKIGFAVSIVALLTLMNLRGVRESGTAFAIPTYAFMIGVFALIAWGFTRVGVFGDELRAPSAGYTVLPHEGYESLTGLALAFLVLRAFSSGCAALTGVEAISNGVPAFRKPKSRNAATTLLLLGLIAVTMFAGVLALGRISDTRFAEDASHLIGPDGKPVAAQDPIIAQVSAAVFGDQTLGFTYVTVATALILFLAANTAFNGFPVLGSILARDGYLPRQLHTRGDRLAFSNGIVLLAGFACLLIYAFRADVTRLIQLYIIGVFVSFTLSQTGMVRHWTRLLRTETDPRTRRDMMRSRVINAVGLTCTGLVLVIVLLTKFTKGAWIVCVAMPIIFFIMRAIRKHYERVRAELAVDETDDEAMLPARNHGIVLVSKIHKPTLRALTYARASRPTSLEAITVNVDPGETRALQAEWDRLDIPVPLKVLDSPFREVTRPIVDYVKSIRRSSPRDVITVYIPEYVVGRWWEQLLHNQSALRLKGRLLFTPGVMVTNVPFQLRSSARAADRPEAPAAGAVRRGERSGSNRSGSGGGEPS
ncbi:MAG: APC family permease [Sporichthyaceae bacterium]|nr:APC family permease [Sporichthyaceae bacterium]